MKWKQTKLETYSAAYFFADPNLDNTMESVRDVFFIRNLFFIASFLFTSTKPTRTCYLLDYSYLLRKYLWLLSTSFKFKLAPFFIRNIVLPLDSTCKFKWLSLLERYDVPSISWRSEEVISMHSFQSIFSFICLSLWLSMILFSTNSGSMVCTMLNR